MHTVLVAYATLTLVSLSSLVTTGEQSIKICTTKNPAGKTRHEWEVGGGKRGGDCVVFYGCENRLACFQEEWFSDSNQST